MKFLKYSLLLSCFIINIHSISASERDPRLAPFVGTFTAAGLLPCQKKYIQANRQTDAATKIQSIARKIAAQKKLSRLKAKKQESL